jgi:hypothetical protein
MLRLNHKLFIISLFFFIVYAPYFIRAQETIPSSVKLKADNIEYDEQTGAVNASGNIKLNFFGYDVSAQFFELASDKETLRLQKDIEITKAGQQIQTDVLEYNFEQNQGLAYNVKLNLDNMHITGQKMFLASDKISIWDAQFTTCKKESPDYLIKSKEIQFYPKLGFFVAFDDVLYFKNLPILYLPSYIYGSSQYIFGGQAMVSPIPMVGQNENEGFFIKEKIGYFLNLNASGSFDFGYIERDGVYGGINHFYSLSKNHDFNFQLYYVEKYLVQTRFSYNWRLTRPGAAEKHINLIDEFLFNFYQQDLPLTHLNFIVSYNDLINTYRVSYLPMLKFGGNKIGLPLNFILNTDINIGNIRERVSGQQLLRGNLNSSFEKKYQINEKFYIKPELSYYGFWYENSNKWERVLGVLGFNWDLGFLAPSFSYTKVFHKQGSSPFLFDAKDAIENDEIGAKVISELYGYTFSLESNYNLTQSRYRNINFISKIGSDCYKFVFNLELINQEFAFGVEIN